MVSFLNKRSIRRASYVCGLRCRFIPLPSRTPAGLDTVLAALSWNELSYSWVLLIRTPFPPVLLYCHSLSIAFWIHFCKLKSKVCASRFVNATYYFERYALIVRIIERERRTYSLSLCVDLQAVLTELASNTGHLVATEGCSSVEDVVAVHPLWGKGKKNRYINGVSSANIRHCFFFTHTSVLFNVKML